MSVLSVDAVIGCSDGREVTVPCPEWGGDVKLITMESQKYDEFEARMSLAQDKPGLMAGIRAEFIAACWADESGNRANIPPNQLAALKKKSPIVMGRLFKEAYDLHQDVGKAEGN